MINLCKLVSMREISCSKLTKDSKYLYVTNVVVNGVSETRNESGDVPDLNILRMTFYKFVNSHHFIIDLKENWVENLDVWLYFANSQLRLRGSFTRVTWRCEYKEIGSMFKPLIRSLLKFFRRLCEIADHYHNTLCEENELPLKMIKNSDLIDHIVFSCDKVGETSYRKFRNSLIEMIAHYDDDGDSYYEDQIRGAVLIFLTRTKNLVKRYLSAHDINAEHTVENMKSFAQQYLLDLY